MYSIFARVAFGTLSAVAISAFSPVFAEVDDDEVDLVVKLGKPLVFGAEQHVSSSKNAPPIARAAPVTDVIVMPDHLADVQQKLRDHPSQRRAAQSVCEAGWRIMLGQSNYYPRLNATLSGGSKWIDQTTRADEFGGSNSPEYDGKGLNATLTLRQSIFDWGRNRAVIEGYRHDRFVAEIERAMTLEEQLATLLQMSLRYVLQVRLVQHFAGAKEIVDRDVESMAARYRAGAARLAEMRQARLTGLEVESRLTQAQRQRDLIGEAMNTQFNIKPQDAEGLVNSFIALRPDIPPVIDGVASSQARLIKHNIDKAQVETERLQAERRPAFTGVVTARGWDIGQKNRCNDLVSRSDHPDAGSFVRRDRNADVSNDNPIIGYRRDQNCNTYELSGALEFNLPLYDGGANAAQRGGVNARRMGLEAELAAQRRSHNSESRRLQDQLRDELIQLAETQQKLIELETQIASERLLSTRTRGNLLNLLSLEQRFADETARRISLTHRAEGTRMEALHLAGRLADTLTITLGDSGC